MFKTLEAVTPKPERPDFRGWEWFYLHSQVQNQRFTFPFQKGAMGWSPSGKSLATLDQTGLVNIWDIRTGLLETSLQGCPGNISSLSWSPDGTHLAAGSDRKVVVIWEVESGLLLRSLRDVAPVRCVDWHPDAVRVACGRTDGAVSVWDSRTGERLASFMLNSGPVGALDWHPEGILLLACGGPGGSCELRIWDTGTAAEVFNRKTTWGMQASFSPDGRRIVSGTEPISIIDLETHELILSRGERGTGNYHTTWGPDGQRLASSLLGGEVEILDVETGVVTASIPGDDGRNFNLVWSPRGEYVATSANGKVKVWDIGEMGDNPATLSTPGRAALSVAFSPDGRHLLEGAQFGLLRMWDVVTGEEALSLKAGLVWHRTVAFSPDGRRFAAKGTDGVGAVVIHDAETGKQLLQLTESDDEMGSLDWSPDGKALAVGYRNSQFRVAGSRVEVFDTHSGQVVAASSYTVGDGSAVAWSPDGNHLAASGGSTRIWDPMLRDERIVAVPSSCLDWSPDSEQLATGSKDGKITIYNALTWTPSRVLEGHKGFVVAVAWHPHMPRIASASRDGTVRIFDTSTGRELYVLDAHRKLVTDVDWSPDGLRLASAGYDGHVRIWDGSLADRYLQQHGDLRQEALRLAQQEKYQDAIDTLERLRTLHPKEKALKTQVQRMRWLLASKLAVDGQASEAVAILEQLHAESADVPDYRLRLPGELFFAEKHDAAIAMAEEFVAEFPETREYRDELAFLYESRATQLCQVGRFEEATPIFRKLADRFRDRPDFRSHLAFEMARADRLDETIQTLEKLAKAFDAWPDYRPTLARRLSSVGEHGLAATVYQQLMDDYPDAREYRALQKSASAHGLIDEGQLDEVKTMLLDLTEKTSGEEPPAEANSEEGKATAQETEIDQAIVKLSDALGLAYFRRGTEAAGRGEFRLAFRDYVSASDLTSNNASILNNVAWGLVTNPEPAFRDASRAVALASKAVKLSPDETSHWNTLGVAQYRAGDLTAAVNSLNKSLKLDEPSGLGLPYNAFFLAMAHWQLGEQDEARSWYDKAAQWMTEDKSNDEELLRFRADAEALLASGAHKPQESDGQAAESIRQEESDSPDEP